ncbi:MAG: sulfatase-like hydrolase/transferase [Anaerolineales bacterium]|nr:sulfatase-like hydrolase/transferase [Anaerolineales bacterium]
MSIRSRLQKQCSFTWASLMLTTIITAFLFALSEWSFMVTKPSFMSAISFLEKLKVLLYAGSLISFLCLVAILLLMGLSGNEKNSRTRYMKFVGIIVPSGVLGTMALLLVDNFTYTVFNFGIVSVKGSNKLAYAVLFCVLVYLSLHELCRLSEVLDRRISKIPQKKTRTALVSALFLIAAVIVITPIRDQSKWYDTYEGSILQDRPHIFLFTLEATNATHVSLYGYERETTPFLEELGDSSIVALNAFTNSANTYGSVASILTGKYPTSTRVLNAPDIFRGQDAYEHLPGILRSHGYDAIQYGVENFLDASKQGLINSFDEGNGRAYNSSIYYTFLSGKLPTDIAQFLYETGNRVIDRLRHIFFMKEMTNVMEDVTTSDRMGSIEKLTRALYEVDHSENPLFINIHWMGTHDKKLFPSEQVFSAGKDPMTQEECDIDFYDDAILDFDRQLERFYNELVARDLADNSIIIIATDHGRGWVVDQRLPLLIHFPGGKFSRTITGNVQGIDIAPTILDYLQLEIPEWMDGASLLGEIPDDRPVFSIHACRGDNDNGSSPPFYQLDGLAVTICDDMYNLDLRRLRFRTHEMEGYFYPCEAGGGALENALDLIAEHLSAGGYDIAVLEENRGEILMREGED